MQIDSKSLVEKARGLAAELATRAGDADREGCLPTEDIRALVDSGYTTLSIPREYGGYGLSLVDCIAAQLELAQGSASTAVVAAMPLQIFGHASEQRYWPEPLFEQMCQAVVTEQAVFNVTASEPTLGSPSHGGAFQTRAELTDRGWLVNGHKNWATGGTHLTHLLVRLNIGDDPSILLIPNNIAGIEWVNTWQDALSLRASDSHDVYFKDVIVPESNVVERPMRKNEPPNVWFAATLTAVYLGAALAARNAVIKYALERVPTALGKSISTLPNVQRQIGEIDLALQAATTLLLEACRGWTGEADNSRTRMAQYMKVVAAKTLVMEVAPQVTMKALHIAGGSSLAHNLPLERFFRDSQAGFSHPPSGSTAYELIGQQAINMWLDNVINS